MKLRELIKKWFGKTPARPTKRVCANCHRPIRKTEHWSAKRWPDGQPRHWAPCPSQRPQSEPTGAAEMPEAVAEENA